MTTAYYRKRQREIAAFYERAFMVTIAISCAWVTAAWCALLFGVMQ